MQAGQWITFILGCIVVIFGAYYATYLVAKGGRKTQRSRVIQVLDRFSLAKDKHIVIVEVYDKIYLVAFTAGGVTLLDNIDPQTVDFYEKLDQQEYPDNAGFWGRFGQAFSAQLRQRGPGRRKTHSDNKQTRGKASFSQYLAESSDDLARGFDLDGPSADSTPDKRTEDKRS